MKANESKFEFETSVQIDSSSNGKKKTTKEGSQTYLINAIQMTNINTAFSFAIHSLSLFLPLWLSVCRNVAIQIKHVDKERVRGEGGKKSVSALFLELAGASSRAYWWQKKKKNKIKTSRKAYTEQENIYRIENRQIF